jgi:hypothetical protein
VQPRFIVSTGRCGSTLLSRLLALHPGVLSLSETLAAMQPGAFPPGEIGAERFWALLTRPHPVWTHALRHHVDLPELLYPVDGGGRFTRETGVPPLAAVTLPALGDDPDALLDELEPIVGGFSRAPIDVQYRRLFEALAGRLGRAVWVERSGVSLNYVDELLEHFPDGRYLHLYRDGRETAVSMSRHAASHLYLRALEGPVAGAAAPPIPLERFGRHWSAMIVRGTRRLAKLPPRQVMHLSYAALVADPARELAAVADFFALPEADWIDAAAVLVRRRPPAWRELPDGELERLERACEPGRRRLRRLEAA